MFESANRSISLVQMDVDWNQVTGFLEEIESIAHGNCNISRKEISRYLHTFVQKLHSRYNFLIRHCDHIWYQIFDLRPCKISEPGLQSISNRLRLIHAHNLPSSFGSRTICCVVSPYADFLLRKFWKSPCNSLEHCQRFCKEQSHRWLERREGNASKRVVWVNCIYLPLIAKSSWLLFILCLYLYLLAAKNEGMSRTIEPCKSFAIKEYRQT